MKRKVGWALVGAWWLCVCTAATASAFIDVFWWLRR